MYGQYVQGKLALAGVDLSADLDVWLNAVYAAFADAPHEVLQQLMRKLVVEEARLRPETARATWGLLPEHQAMAGSFKGGGGQSAGQAPPAQVPRLPSGRRSGRPQL